MGFWNDLFGQKKESEAKAVANEHAVIIHFTYYKDDLDPLHTLEQKLEEAIKEKQVGEYDGHEIAVDMSDGSLFMYGVNAGALFKVVKPILEQTDFMKGAWATLRFGGAISGAKEIEIQLEK